MKLYYSDHYILPLPEGHRFPMLKYSMLRKRITLDGLVPPGILLAPDLASDEQLCLVHEPEYIHKVAAGKLSEKEIRRIGFPWSESLVNRSRSSVGATIAACRAAVEDGLSANLAGGTHHAHAGHGEGYCVYNDVAVAARVMQTEGRASRIVILDCDVHQGNGTAAIFKNDSSIFTFSIHGAKNFPFHKEESCLDIALSDGTQDEEYLPVLEEGLSISLSKANADLAIYLAGADPFEGDALGRMSLTKEGLAARDRSVLQACQKAGLPVAITMSGGYAKNVEDTVDIHFNTIRLAIQFLWGEPGKYHREREDK
jgi:acetoin utilization deacetylase AcuC-like enzyme